MQKRVLQVEQSLIGIVIIIGQLRQHLCGCLHRYDAVNPLFDLCVERDKCAAVLPGHGHIDRIHAPQRIISGDVRSFVRQNPVNRYKRAMWEAQQGSGSNTATYWIAQFATGGTSNFC
jgi:hypothetical protein